MDKWIEAELQLERARTDLVDERQAQEEQRARSRSRHRRYMEVTKWHLGRAEDEGQELLNGRIFLDNRIRELEDKCTQLEFGKQERDQLKLGLEGERHRQRQKKLEEENLEHFQTINDLDDDLDKLKGIIRNCDNCWQRSKLAS